MSIPRNYGEYNCGGYALQTYTWYCPKGTGFYRTMVELLLLEEEDYKPLDTFYVNNLRKDFPNLIEIPEEQVRQRNYDKKHYTVIAYRTMLGTYFNGRRDFHFLRLGRNGIWYHKRGGQNWIHTMKEEDVYKPWPFSVDHSYDAPIHFFLIPLKA